MSTKQMEVRVDDITGEVLMDNGQHTKVILDGEVAELDLSPENYNALREVLAPYFRAANGPSSTVKGTTTRRVASASNAPKTRTDREGLKAIREWAVKNGFKVSERGRIPYSVMDAYAKTHISAA